MSPKKELRHNVDVRRLRLQRVGSIVKDRILDRIFTDIVDYINGIENMYVRYVYWGGLRRQHANRHT